jgi:hypothetical protein
MTVTTDKQSMAPEGMVLDSTDNLPAELQVAQAAIELPEVQDILRRLADFNLGVYMPHLHENETGRFLPMPEGYIQVEDDLKVTFPTEEEIAADNDPMIQVGWVWRGDGVRGMAKCVQSCKKMGSQHDKLHKGEGEDEY